MVPWIVQLGSLALVAFVVAGWFRQRRDLPASVPAQPAEAGPVRWWRPSA